MKRRIINIDESKCNGCGACANACHEGAIAMVNGKAKLMRDDFCDGLGDCLPACPTGAITFTEREAVAYNEAAVLEAKKAKQQQSGGCPGTFAQMFGRKPAGGCPGSRAAEIERPHTGGCPGSRMAAFNRTPAQAADAAEPVSQLRQWPVQIKLAPINAPWLNGADVLIAADCTAYSRADFHARFMQDKVTLIGCPKLDSVDYSEKLAEMFSSNDIASITVVRMQVPCCGGITAAVERAIAASGKRIPMRVVILSTDGRIVRDETV